MAFTVLPNFAAVFAQRHDQATHAMRQRGAIGVQFFAQHEGFVIIDRDPAGLCDQCFQFVGVELGQLLPGVEHERNARSVQLLGVQLHGFFGIGRNDGHGNGPIQRHVVGVRQTHGAGVKGTDLVVVLVGHYGALAGVAILAQGDATGVDAQLLEAFQIVATVFAQCGQGQRLCPQLLDGIGDIARAAAIVAAHVRRQKRDVQPRDLLRQDLIGKAPVENQNIVKGHGAGNENGHMYLCRDRKMKNADGKIRGRKRLRGSPQCRAVPATAAVAPPPRWWRPIARVAG